MIKILKPGITKEICPKCGCHFSYEKEDLDIPNPVFPFKATIKCPWCNERLSLIAKL